MSSASISNLLTYYLEQARAEIEAVQTAKEKEIEELTAGQVEMENILQEYRESGKNC